MKVDSCPIRYVPYTNREPVWIRPELVVEVKFQSWTNDRIMRAPIFLRLREDKSPNECRIEMEEDLTEVVRDVDATTYHTLISNNQLMLIIYNLLTSNHSLILTKSFGPKLKTTGH